jgi:hypothetical protein
LGRSSSVGSGAGVAWVEQGAQGMNSYVKSKNNV